MRREQLEAALCAAAATAGVNEFILAGSQSVFAHANEVPMEVLISDECDVWAKGRFEKLEMLGPTLGRDSVYQRIQTFPEPHQQAVLLARLRISSETMP